MSSSTFLVRWIRQVPVALIGFTLPILSISLTAQPRPLNREFPPGALRNITQLPASRLLTQLERLPADVRDRGLQWLRGAHITEGDLASLHADRNGGIFYVCEVGIVEAAEDSLELAESVELAAVPISPFPAGLIFHSRPGAANVLYINFAGENVIGTEWNDLLGRTEIPALPFSSDSEYSTYSDAEQLVIRSVWQRMAEDYAPFDIDVTTERPAVMNSRTAMALITGTKDANDDANPHNAGGGVAYLNCFGTGSYARYRPAWIYHDNLGHNASYIAEAASHEVGHNLGLSHDGKTDGSDYYGGHGTGDISWGPIMGTGYYRNVSQWCKGEYYLGNNTQDDLSTIAAKVSYRPDDHGNTPGTATPLVLTGGTNIVSTNPENDPTNAYPANKGALELNTDLDIFSFVTGSGSVRLAVNPWIMPSGTRGGNLDISIALYDAAGLLLQTNNPLTQTTAFIETNLPAGRYYLHVNNSGAGGPFISVPTGYTVYGSIGQYFISGYVSEATSGVIAPSAEAWLTDLSQAGQASHPFTVTYTDVTAVRLSSLDSMDLLVTGPNGYSELALFMGADLPADGSPLTGSYSIPAPGGTWDDVDSGTYLVTLLEGAVEDTLNHGTPETVLGSFDVAISTPTPGWLEVQSAAGLNASGTAGGPFDPSSVTYTLTNSGGSSLEWIAGRTQNWVSLSASSGALGPGDSTMMTVTINGYAEGLIAGNYSNSITFVNATAGGNEATRVIDLNIIAPGQLDVTPGHGLDARGYAGGPYSPVSINYNLVNTGGTTIAWSATKTADWIELTANSGTLDPEATTTVTMMLSANAGGLAAGIYEDTIILAGSTGIPRLLPVTLRVSAPPEFIGYSLTQPGEFQMLVEALTGTQVVIEASSDLMEWTGIWTNPVAIDGTVRFSDSPTEQRTRWYRARAMP